MKSQDRYSTLPDGTLKHIHPLTGAEVWTIPNRAHRPFSDRHRRTPKPLTESGLENYCDFCQAEYFRTPPEKARLIQTSDGNFQKIDRLNPDLLEASQAFLRRIANLFEIVTLDYWKKNHGFQLTPAQEQWKKNYMGNSRGLEHLLQILETKLRLSGISPEDILRLPMNEKLKIAEAFFGGSHDLIVAGRHFKQGASWDNDFFSSGEMTPEEHYQFFRFTLDALTDIFANNKNIRYVMTFQNWLQAAGASFDHLHKQLVGMDEWGPIIRNQISLVRENPNLFNEAIVNFSWDHDLVFAENEHAIALSEIGHRHPTLGIYSKSPNTRPWEHTEEEIRGISDLVQACHAGMGSQVPCNEEWYYSPPDAEVLIPWHILIKWRTVNPAGFEGGTGIYINPVSPVMLRDQVVPRLYELRTRGKIRNFRIAMECSLKTDPLLYGKK